MDSDPPKHLDELLAAVHSTIAKLGALKHEMVA